MGEIVHVQVKSLNKVLVFHNTIWLCNFRDRISSKTFCDSRCWVMWWSYLTDELWEQGYRRYSSAMAKWCLKETGLRKQDSSFQLCPVIWKVRTLNCGLGNIFLNRWFTHMVHLWQPGLCTVWWPGLYILDAILNVPALSARLSSMVSRIEWGTTNWAIHVLTDIIWIL